MKDNDAHTSTGVFSKKRWDALQSHLREEHQRILSAKGFTEHDADPVMRRIVDGFNQSVVMMNSYFEFLASTGGPVSVKGRTRRAVEGWSRAADRVAKFATMLGLQRKARRMNETPAEWLERIGQQHQSNIVEEVKSESEPDAKTGRQAEQTERNEP